MLGIRESCQLYTFCFHLHRWVMFHLTEQAPGSLSLKNSITLQVEVTINHRSGIRYFTPHPNLNREGGERYI